MSDTKHDAVRFSEQLPFFVNGTLDSSESAWMTAYMERHPEARQQYRFVEFIQNNTASLAPPSDESQRLQEFLQKYRSTPRNTGISSLWRWFSAPWSLPSYVIAGLMALAVTETLILGTLAMQEVGDQPQYRGEAAYCPGAGDIRVKFAANAKALDIANLLRQANLRVIDGPSVNGEFWVRAGSREKPRMTLTELRNNSLVDDAVAFDPRDGLAACRPSSGRQDAHR